MNTTPHSSDALLRLEHVSKAFGGNQVLHDVNFSVAKGEIVGLLGPNGSGKSTLLNLITGFGAIDNGKIEFRGQSIGSLPAYKIVKSGVGRTFQLPSMPKKMSVMEVAMAAATSHHGVIETMLQTVGVKHAEAAAHAKATVLLEQLLLTHVRDLPASALSGGQKKLLGIVCALMSDPQLLMLDEPTAGVHPNLRRDIVQSLQTLNRKGMTLVIVEHDMHFIREVCTRCIVLDRGKIVASCHPDELASNEHVVQAYLGRVDKQQQPELAEVE